MAHKSETNIKLQLVDAGVDTLQKFSENDVWFIKLPYYISEWLSSNNYSIFFKQPKQVVRFM